MKNNLEGDVKIQIDEDTLKRLRELEKNMEEVEKKFEQPQLDVQQATLAFKTTVDEAKKKIKF